MLLSVLLLSATTSWTQVTNKADSAARAKDSINKIKEDSANKAKAANHEKPAPPPKTTPKPDSATSQAAPANVDSTSLMNRYQYDLAHYKEYYPAKGASNWRLWPAIIGGLLLAFISRYLMYNTPLCKDLSYYPGTSNLRPADKRPFSYSKVQLFWWTVIILSTFLAYYIYTGYLISFTPSMVLLLGGGLAVAVFGKVIDNTQMNQDTNSVPTRHQDLKDSEGLFTDILSDEGGISIHRYQAVIMNMIFGIAFIGQFLQSIFGHEKYPFLEFESWQLTLMGVSSAAFLGLKSSENSSATKPKREEEAVQNTKAAPPPTPTTKAFQSLENDVKNR
jgi:hypothetical protein